MASELKVKTKKVEGSIVVTTEGRIDANTAVLLDKEMSPLINETKSLIIDFDKLEYISSAGLRILIGVSKALKKNEGEVKIINVSEGIMEIFIVTGFLNKLDITSK